MELQYKPDWEKTKENFKAWWEREYFGRCAIALIAPKDGVNVAAPPVPEKVEDRWLDFDYLTASIEYRLKTTFFGGENFPIWDPGYPGYDCHAVYLGCGVTIAEDTSWVHPIISEGELTSYDYSKFKIDKGSDSWKLFLKLRNYAVQDSKGKCVPGNMCFGSTGDTLASMRSSEKLLLDLVECPEYVRDFEIYLMKQWIEIYEESYAITHEAAEGSTCWFGFWSPRKFYGVQNDFSYMISSKMYEDVFLPALKMQTDYLDHAVYHVDGVSAFRHVDTLLGLKKLQALQILPGSGKPSPLYYMDVLKKVQAAKHNLQIMIEPGEIKDALENLSARGLHLTIFCKTESEAKDVLKYAEKNSVDRG